MNRWSKFLGAAALAAALVGGGVAMAAAKDVLVINLVAEPASLDPHLEWNPDSYFVYRNVFDNMLTRDNEGKISPQVATQWRQIDPKTVEFDVRTDIKFHDGSALTAEDVVYSIKRITDPALKSPQLGQFNKITGAEAVGPAKVRLTTDGPYPVLYAQLVKLSIVPMAHVEKIGKDRFNQEPMGSGPYKFAAIQRGVKVTLARNDAYWGAKGAFPTVEFHAVPDVATRVANLRSGRSDLIVTITPDQANELKNDARAKVLSVKSERVAYFMLNALTGPTADLRVRQAIAHAIDKNAIVTALLGGFDNVSNVIASPAHVGYAEGFKGYAYDPAKARALLAQAGDAAKAEMTLFTSPTFDQRIVTAIQQMLTDVGLKVKITSTDFPNWLKRAQSAPAEFGEMTFSRWSCGCQDADGIMFPLLHSSSQWAKSKNAEMDAALDAARSALDANARVQHYRKVSEIVEATVPLVPLYQVGILYGARKELRWQPTPNESLFLNRMGWDG